MINVYDFDETIYDGDSTVDFYKYCIKRKKSILWLVPKTLWAFCLYIIGLRPKEYFKEKFYKFLTKIDNVEEWVEDFWNKNEHKIKQFYLNNRRDDDLVISASPEFIIKPICNRLGIRSMASLNDPLTGKYADGINCHGKQKVVRLNAAYPNEEINEFYSDSYSDTPLAELAKKAVLVKGDKLFAWNEYEPKGFAKIKQMFFNREFIMFLVVGVINTFNGVVFSFIYSLIIPDANISFMIGYVTSLTISYILNSKISFKEELNFKKYIKFCISYIPNFIIQNVVVLVVYNMMHLHKLIAYVLAAILGIPITFIFIKVFAFGKKH